MMISSMTLLNMVRVINQSNKSAGNKSGVFSRGPGLPYPQCIIRVLHGRQSKKEENKLNRQLDFVKRDSEFSTEADLRAI